MWIWHREGGERERERGEVHSSSKRPAEKSKRDKNEYITVYLNLVYFLDSFYCIKYLYFQACLKMPRGKGLIWTDLQVSVLCVVLCDCVCVCVCVCVSACACVRVSVCRTLWRCTIWPIPRDCCHMGTYSFYIFSCMLCCPLFNLVQNTRCLH